ncbi:MAG: SpoIIE family protein phosphatase [Actinobacteria bacterium]|nr:SpoIIE family protein phosphatase [Actinomycetota bacterium]
MNAFGPRKGIRRKLLLSYLAIIIPLIIVIVFTYYNRYEDKRQDIITSRIVFARVVASDFDHFVKEVVTTEKAVGLAIQDNDYTRRRASEYLSKIANRYPVFDMNYVRLSGEIYASSNPRLVGRQIEHDWYDIDSLRNERGWTVSALHEHENGEIGFDIAAGIPDGSKLAGVVVASVDVTRLNEFFAFDVPSGGYNITDSNGTVIYQSQYPKLSLERRDWKSYEFIRESLEGREFSSPGLTFPVDNSYRMGAQVPIHSIGWSSGSFVTVEEVMLPIGIDVLRSAAMAMVVGLMAVFFGLWLGGSIVRSVAALADKARAIARGSFEEDIGSIKTGDEIEDLAQSLNTMQISLRDYVNELSGIVEAGERMNLALNIPFVESAVIKALRDYFGAEAVWIALYDEHEKHIAVEHFWDMARGVDFSGLRLSPGQGVAGRVLMTGKPEITKDIESSEFVYKDLALRAGIDSAITLPLISGGGALGVVGLYTPLIRQNRVTEKEMSLLMALANQAAVAIENARLYEETRQSEQRLKESNYDLRVLNKLALDISSGLDLVELLEKAVKNAMDLVGADIGSVGLYDEESGKIEFRYKITASKLPVTLEIPEDLGLAETVLKSRRTILTNDYQHDPRAFNDALVLGINAVAVIPLLIGNRLIGVIQIGSTSGKTFSCGDVALLEAVGSQAAVAIENAKLYERERDIAEALQNALLAVPDKLAGIKFSLLYRAATEKSKVGGDFYDFIEFTNGRIGIVVGDVSGKGLEAAMATALAKMTIRAFAYEYDSPAEVLAHANSVLASQMAPGQFITIAYIIIDPATGALSYASAGHPTPVIADRAASSVRQLTIGSTPLGAIAEGAEYKNYSDKLSEGEVILLYTDGLLEARNNGMLFGEEGISQALLAIDDIDIAGIPDMLLHAAQEFARGKLDDDVAIVALSLDRGGEGEAPEKDIKHMSDWVI